MDIFILALITLFASIIGTLAGFGVSTIMVPLTVFFLPLSETLLLVGIIHIFNDVWQMLLFRCKMNWKLLLSFGIPGLIASYIAASLVIENTSGILMALGLILFAYGTLVSMNFKIRLKQNTLNSILGGTLSGLLAALFGIGGPTRSVFLISYKIPKRKYIFMSGAIAILIDISRVTAYLGKGVWLNDTYISSIALFMLLSFLGAEIARRIANKVSQKSFRKIVGILLIIISLKLVLFS